jgi:hypothetical protein
VAGPNDHSTLKAGEYEALVTVWLPKGSSVTGVRGEDFEVHRGSDGGYTLEIAAVLVPPQATRVVAVSFAGGLGEVSQLPLVFLPQGRVRPVPVTVRAHLATGWDGPTELATITDGPLRGIWARRATKNSVK